MRSLEKVLDEIEKLQNENLILPLQEKLLFIITDAGPNDFTEESFDNTRVKAKELNLKTYFIYPDGSGVRRASSSLLDTPGGAYEDLTDLVFRYESGDSGDGDINFRKFKFSFFEKSLYGSDIIETDDQDIIRFSGRLNG